MKKFLDILAKIWNSEGLRTFILLGTIIVFIILYWNSCQSIKQKDDTYKQNQEAIKKELKTSKNKNGKLQTSVAAWEGKAKDLGKYSKELEEEVKAVKKSKVKIIIKTDVKYSSKDTVEIDNTIDSLGNGEYKLNWAYTNEDSSRVLDGESHFIAKLNKSRFSLNITPGKTFINKDEITISLITGVKHNKKTGFDEIFVTPKTPGVTVSGLEGAILNKPKKKRISVVAGIGYGIGVDGNNRLILTPTINLTIGKSLFSF